MPQTRATRDRRIVLPDIDWTTYSRLLRAFAERPAVRLTYDRGTLEIMSPLLRHDNRGRFLGRMVIVLTEELGLPVMGGGSTTFRRRGKRKGLEADDCFWIANEPQMRGKDHVDLRVDPPPDLAIEVDVTRSSLDRMAIYSALRVPEVWRMDDPGTLSFHALQPKGDYQDVSHSVAFSFVTPAALLRFLALRATLDENTVIAQFRAWVRQQISSKSKTP
jgi:Uma2 family endonuclease